MVNYCMMQNQGSRDVVVAANKPTAVKRRYNMIWVKKVIKEKEEEEETTNVIEISR